MTKKQLADKVKGGWAAKTIGCTYGGPTEFKYNGTMIQEYVPIPWRDGYMRWWYESPRQSAPIFLSPRRLRCF